MKQLSFLSILSFFVYFPTFSQNRVGKIQTIQPISINLARFIPNPALDYYIFDFIDKIVPCTPPFHSKNSYSNYYKVVILKDYSKNIVINRIVNVYTSNYYPSSMVYSGSIFLRIKPILIKRKEIQSFLLIKNTTAEFAHTFEEKSYRKVLSSIMKYQSNQGI